MLHFAEIFFMSSLPKQNLGRRVFVSEGEYHQSQSRHRKTPRWCVIYFICATNTDTHAVPSSLHGRFAMQLLHAVMMSHPYRQSRFSCTVVTTNALFVSLKRTRMVFASRKSQSIEPEPVHVHVHVPLHGHGFLLLGRPPTPPRGAPWSILPRRRETRRAPRWPSSSTAASRGRAETRS